MRFIVLFSVFIFIVSFGLAQDNKTVKPQTKRRGFMVDVGRFDDTVAKELAEKWNVNLVRFQMRSRFWADKHRVSYAEGWRKIVEMLPSVLDAAKKNGITLVLDLHGRTPNDNSKNYPKGKAALSAFWNDEENLRIMIKCWEEVAQICKDREEDIWFDLLNEPLNWDDFPGTPKNWPRWAQQVIDAIRKIDRRHAIVIEPGPGGICWAFKDYPLLSDDNLIYSLHQYQPHSYTHQGVKDIRGTDLAKVYEDIQIPWPAKLADGNVWDKDRIRKELEPVLKFQKKYGVKIFVGEFSVARWALNGDKYLDDCISLFEEYGWDWTYHAFRESHIWSLEHEESYTLTPQKSEGYTKRAQVVRKYLMRNER